MQASRFLTTLTSFRAMQFTKVGWGRDRGRRGRDEFSFRIVNLRCLWNVHTVGSRKGS